MEKNTSFVFAKKLPKGKDDEALAKAVITMLLPYIDRIRPITRDKGSEVTGYLMIATRLRTRIFFAHPYSFWEKGCIEYHDKLMRQYIPKEPTLMTF